MNLWIISSVILLLIISPISINAEIQDQSSLSLWDADIILVSPKDPYFSLLGSSIACYYPFQNDTATIKPLLLNSDNELSEQHQRFIQSYSQKPIILSIGPDIAHPFISLELPSNPPQTSLAIASYYQNCTEAVVIPYGPGENYSLSLQATLLSSYLHIPLIIFHQNGHDIQQYLEQSSINTLYLIGDINPEFFPSVNHIVLSHQTSISNQLLKIIKQQFLHLDYITLTNPLDIQKKHITSVHTYQDTMPIKHLGFTILGKTYMLSGTGSIQYDIPIPSGIHHLEYLVNFTSKQNNELMNSIEPLIKTILTDPNNQVVGYTQSSSYDVGELYLDTLIVDHPGTYTLTMYPYHGLKGGYFSSRGFSHVDGEMYIKAQDTKLDTSHLPRVQNLSLLAPYLTSSYGGYLIANESYSLTSSEYDIQAKGFGTGPWYAEDLIAFNNEKVNQTIQNIQYHLDLIDHYDLLTSYEQGPAWFAILADTNMVPMYYFSPSQTSLYEKGLPSDNPYSFNETFSIGRIMGYSDDDVSNLICRTLFYKTICTNQDAMEWRDAFHFMYGEGFGETGGFFHQIPYAEEIQQYGFDSTVYGDFKNSRYYAERNDVFTGANYNEYLGHGDWFWFAPSFYGFDIHMRAFDVAHLKHWVFERPSLFLTSACLMGRVDGIAPWNNIGMTLLHAGCNAFVGATRETGRESGLEILENSLIRNDTSIGEALLQEKQIDKELPTFYVRTFYGDPAFNPYEPDHGFTIERKQ